MASGNDAQKKERRAPTCAWSDSTRAENLNVD